MNNNTNNSSNGNNNIDDILDILQKRKQQNMMNSKNTDDAPTRLDHTAVPAANSNSSSDNNKTRQIPINVPSEKKVSENIPNKNIQNPLSAQTHTSPIKAKPEGAHGVSGFNSSHQSSQNQPVISLNDFDDKNVEKATQRENRRRNKKKRGVPGWIKVVIYLILVIVASIFISVTVIKVSNDVFAFIKSDRDITINIDENTSLSQLSQILYDADIIEYPFIFKNYAKSKIKKRSYLTEDFTPGEHTLSPSMNYDKIIATLCVSSYDNSVVRVTIPEGYTFNGIMDLFVEKGIMKEQDKEEYLKQLQQFPYEYDFITKITQQKSFDNENRIHRLEGYLFPDTYDFYKNENPVSVIDKLLSNFENKFSDEMYTRAGDLGMTVDEIITLASIIEAEGDSPVNFAKISSVFHNRLNDKSGKFKFLGSDATTLYALRISGQDKKTLGGGDTDFVHPYNTYTSIGLPPGPICNPGIEAIYAALYPENTNYLYFLTMANRETVFARTASEHNNNIAKSNRIAAEKKAAQ